MGNVLRRYSPRMVLADRRCVQEGDNAVCAIHRTGLKLTVGNYIEEAAVMFETELNATVAR